MSSLFLNKDGTITSPSCFVLLALPMMLSGRWRIAVSLIVLGMSVALCNAMDQIEERDKDEIRYNVMEAMDVVEDLSDMEHARLQNRKRDDQDSDMDQSWSQSTVALEALAKKIAKEKRRADRGLESVYAAHDLQCLCQEAAYIVLRMFPDRDLTVAAALSLLALVAKDEKVRERHVQQADIYGFNVPIEAMQRALERAKAEELEPSEEDEQQSAELQRKGCLLLGALADGDRDVATHIADEQALDCVLDALRWYRFHQDVANWSLWAIFAICYDHPVNKIRLLHTDGIQTILQTLTNISDSLEVARHGIAVLFDMLREAPEYPNPQLPHIRKAALGAGLHEIVKEVMEEFDESMEIIMMGHEMMAATGYRGDLPKYNPMSS